MDKMQKVSSGHSPHFPTAKVKKMIQNNQEIGKLSSSVPHLLQYSLEVFLEEILGRINQIAIEDRCNKITPSLLKMAVEKSGKYEFLQPTLEALEDTDTLKRRKTDLDRKDIKQTSKSKPRKKRKTESEVIPEDRLDEQ